ARRLAGPVPEPVGAARLAWVLVQTKDPQARNDGLELLRRAAAANPTKEEDRRELAGVFAAAGEYKTAAEVLAPMGNSVADTLKVAELYAGARQWDLAKAELNKAMNSPAATPDEKKSARRELAKITAWSGDHAEALKLIDEIVKAEPDNLEMKILQADVNVWSKNLDQALALFLPLVKQYPNNPKVVTGFANAAAKARGPLSDDAHGILLQITDQATGAKDPLLIARVAEAHATKLNDPVKAQTLALKAAEMNPRDPIVRREVAYTLAHPLIKLFREADALFASMDRSGEDRKQYAFIASQAENYEAARKQARIYLSEQVPGSLKEREAHRLLADILTWKGDYEEALAIYEGLADEQKKDRDLKIEIAEVHRYWQNYPVPPAEFAELLREDFESKQLWIGYTASASTTRKTKHQGEMLLRVFDRSMPEFQAPRALPRLAGVMIRLNERPRAPPLLTRAVRLTPPQPAVRKELAGVLAA